MIDHENSTSYPKISVVVNCYNGEKYLKEAIESVVAQTYPNWELILWDNQSTDRSKDVVEAFEDDRIKYFYAPQHTALGKARKRALTRAAGSKPARCRDATVTPA